MLTFDTPDIDLCNFCGQLTSYWNRVIYKGCRYFMCDSCYSDEKKKGCIKDSPNNNREYILEKDEVSIAVLKWEKR